MNIHPNLSRFAQHATALVRNGWRPLPGYADTKRPSINGWDAYNSRQWEADELQQMIAGRGQQEGQVICLAVQKDVVAVDLDNWRGVGSCARGRIGRRCGFGNRRSRRCRALRTIDRLRAVARLWSRILRRSDLRRRRGRGRRNGGYGILDNWRVAGNHRRVGVKRLADEARVGGSDLRT